MDPTFVSFLLGGLNILGAQKEAQANLAAGAFKATILEDNAKIAELQGADAIARGYVDESKARLETGSLAAKQTTAFAASGVRTDTGGSVADVAATTAGIGELNASAIRSDAVRKAWGFQVEARNLRQNAQLAKMNAQYAADSAYITGYTRAAAVIGGSPRAAFYR
jgi:hypothetical protein